MRVNPAGEPVNHGTRIRYGSHFSSNDLAESPTFDKPMSQQQPHGSKQQEMQEKKNCGRHCSAGTGPSLHE
jgi:hypothetical protein